MNDSPEPPSPWGRLVRVRPGFLHELRRLGISDLEELSRPSRGEIVTTRRTSWVRRLASEPGDLFVKTYDYPTWRDRTRGLMRTTALARSRARREWDALEWLRRHGFEAPEPLAVCERRRWGVLRRAVLVTRSHPGRPLHQLLPELAPGERDAVLQALEDLVSRLHDAGFRDRNLDLRNLLGQRSADGSWRLAKIDSPRHRLVRPGRGTDRLARRDWERLARSLAEVLGSRLAPSR